MDIIKQPLCDEITKELDELEGLELGTESYKIAVDGLTKLMDRAIEITKIELDDQQKASSRALEKTKIDNEIFEKRVSRENDEKFKSEQIEDNKKDQLFKNSIAIASIIVPSMITIWGTLKTLRFEETGTVTTMMGRGFINKLIPKK